MPDCPRALSIPILNRSENRGSKAEVTMLESSYGVSPVDSRQNVNWSGAVRSAPAPSPARTEAIRNGLLSALPSEILDELRPHLELVPLKKRQILHERNVPVSHAYFIECGTASLLSRVEGRNGIEVGSLGFRDFVGVPVVLGTGRTPHRCVVQVPGQAFRIGAADLQQAMEAHPELRRLLFSYVQALMVQSAQLVVCNTRHSVRERLARWLLVARDRLHGNEIEVTHQVLSRVLGVRRAGVTTAMGRMEEAGLIRRGRGRLLIVDCDGLEAEACDCYHAIQAEHQRIACHPAHGPGDFDRRPLQPGRDQDRAPVPGPVSLKGELEKLGPEIAKALATGDTSVSIRVEAEDAELASERIVPLALIVHELVLDAVRHGASSEHLQGRNDIRIAFARSGPKGTLTVSDRRSGPAADTDLSGCRNGLGIRLARTFAAQLGGEVWFDARDQGTRATLEFPL
jgi:CRP-like cAMP-binding protein